ncbi:hypothetical protein [Sorangium sp. So ce128]|uniref:hypothetical protein n=1 Tax=Sorangium sp. So ce128 TaxID=3133281 RepID=UPI003F5E8ABF
MLVPESLDVPARAGAGDQRDSLLELAPDVVLDEPRTPEARAAEPRQGLALARGVDPGFSRAAPRERGRALPEAPPARASRSGAATHDHAPPDAAHALPDAAHAPPDAAHAPPDAAHAPSDAAHTPPGAPDSPPPAAAPPGLGGAPIWVLPGVLPVEPPARSRASERPLAPVRPVPERSARSDAAKDGRQPVLVFPAAGVLASAVAEEVSSSAVPPDSESSFELTLDAKGRLVSVRFLEANTGNGDDFRRVAQAVLKRFSARALAMNGDFTAGSRVTVHVTSRVVMPDGTSHGIPTPTKKPGDGRSIIREDSLDDRFRSPHLAPSPGVKLPKLTFRFDLANIGAQRRRVVSTRVEAVPAALP